MARSTSWMPLALGVVLVGVVVGLAHFASDRVGEGLRGVAQRLPDPPDRAVPSEADLLEEPEPGVPQADALLEDGPRIDLEYPTERDWLFLEGIMRDGTPEARRSAAKALVIMGGMRGVPVLMDAARQPGPDADLFCLAALDVLRLQRWEDAMPALLEVMLDADTPPGQRCRSEVSDRFAVAGGRDAERLATLAGHEDPRIRAFVASYLVDVDPAGYADVLATLAQDADPEVRLRAGGQGGSDPAQPDAPTPLTGAP
jgi:HEAT repeat protein